MRRSVSIHLHGAARSAGLLDVAVGQQSLLLVTEPPFILPPE